MAQAIETSVALATYNGEKFLRPLLESLGAQSILPDEVVISDDCSTDGTVDIVREFASRAPFTVLLINNQARLGYRDNFIKAASSCSSEVILFCDQDDIWHPEKIERLRDGFTGAGVLLCYHKAFLIDENGSKVGKFTCAKLRNPWQTPAGFLTAFRKDLLIHEELRQLSIDFNKPSARYAHDQWVALLARELGEVVFIDRDLAGYRQHATNIYGAEQARLPLLKRLRKRLKNRSEAFVILASVCRSNATVFSSLAERLNKADVWKARALKGQQAYKELAELYDLRAKAYKDIRFLNRLRALLRLLQIGTYRDRGRWSFGSRGLVRDVVLGVLLGRVISRLTTSTSFGDANCQRIA
ncbi:glycosyltransferase family 2 protein [Lichenicoccus sp.]|uniref:glycosyltransferase family 2 protein n=1 Tax=Lichenicoccus sp. TaxID=2781899 RepID=UPI003D1053CA